MIVQRKQSGFSLIELIVYITIVSLVITVIVGFAIDISTTTQKAKVRLDVQQNARFAMERMLQEIRTSQGINTGSSVFDSSPGTLSLSKSSGLIDPTVFDVNAGILRLTQGAGSPQGLTPDNLEVTNLVFRDLSVSNRTEVVQIELTLRHENFGQSDLFNAEVSLTGSATIRTREQ